MGCITTNQFFLFFFRFVIARERMLIKYHFVYVLFSTIEIVFQPMHFNGYKERITTVVVLFVHSSSF